MQHYRFSDEKFVVTRLRQHSILAARRMLIWMVFVLTFTVITSVIAMFEFVNSGTASPMPPAEQWTLDFANVKEIPNNPAGPDWE